MKNDAKFLYPLLILIVITSTSFLNTTEIVDGLTIPGGWTKLGKHTVGEGVTYEEFVFDEEKKNVKRLKLKVLKSSVYLMSIKIIYDDKTSENHRVSRRLEKGETTRAFDLIGHHRVIQKIMFIYRGDTNKGGAQLVVLGKL
ncbi:MAG: hypothetical protein HKN90_05510 [Flavobacteriaceae bacterium]|nr:hypothetical protein [Flavobacteriaceae bacterium]